MLTLVAVIFLVTGVESACKSNPSASDEEDTALNSHNTYRALHKDTAALCYGESGSSVTYTAQAWSESQVAAAKMSHSSSGGYGENLYWTSNGSQDKETAYKTAIKLWYEEIKDWDFTTSAKKTSSSANAMTGHFTQVIWQDTQEVRCGFAQSSSAGTYVTCQYYKPGNYNTRYASNVQPLAPVTKTCEAPTVPNASVYPNRVINAGQSFIATCSSGYELTSGDGTMTCTSSGTLSVNVCSKKVVETCSAPTITNANVSPSGPINVGDIFSVTCMTGYGISGTWLMRATLECSGTGTLPTSPACSAISTCSAPAVGNATVTPTNAINVGEKFTVSCNEGFNIKGEETLTCGESTNAPSCVSSAFIVKGSFVMVGLSILFGIVSSL